MYFSNCMKVSACTCNDCCQCFCRCVRLRVWWQSGPRSWCSLWCLSLTFSQTSVSPEASASFRPLFQIIFRLQTQSWMILYPICSLILVLSGYVLLGVDYYVRESSYVPGQVDGFYIYVGIAIFASLLVSLNWWENPFQASTNIQEMLSELDTFRDTVYLFTSLIRIALTLGVYFLYYCLIIEADARIKWDDFSKASKGTVEIGMGCFYCRHSALLPATGSESWPARSTRWRLLLQCPCRLLVQRH